MRGGAKRAWLTVVHGRSEPRREAHDYISYFRFRSSQSARRRCIRNSAISSHQSAEFCLPSANCTGVSTKMVRQNSRLLVVCGPSGSGKSTLLRKLFDEYPDKFGFSVSHTTRSPRRFEVDGQHYHFITKDQMQAAIDRGEFLEHAIFSNNMYGTSLKAVQNVQKSGKICVLDIDMQGVIQIKKVASLKPVGVFVKPPSIGELEIRLRRRNSESEDNLRARLNVAQQEINYGEMPGNFDCIIINESLDKAYNVFKEFVLKSFESVEN